MVILSPPAYLALVASLAANAYTGGGGVVD